MSNGHKQPGPPFLLTIFEIVFIFSIYCATSNGETCPSTMFSCGSGGCVNFSMVCDQQRDCSDGSDESDCGDICPEGWFHCTNGNCILLRWKCDGENDCGDNSDELNCGRISGECSHEEFRCHDNSKCIPITWVCDGNHDCRDKSDETPGCVRHAPCEGFVCKSSHECLPKRWQCDGSEDCEDASDEFNCTGPENIPCLEKDLKFFCADRSHCLDNQLVCNGIRNCDDGSDEGGQCEQHTCTVAGCSHGCFQTPSKAVCYCPSGFDLENEKTCKDANECLKIGSCSQNCHNSPGSFSCSCTEGYRLSEIDHRTCSAEGPEPILIYSASRELKVIKLRSGLVYSLHSQLSHAVGVDYDSIEDRIYWTEIADGAESIRSSKLDASDTQTLITTGISVVEDVAIDWIGRNLYFTDSSYMRLVVCKQDGSYCNVLIESVRQPRALTLDPPRGIMFWSDWSHTPSIERCGMDGSERSPLVTTNLEWPNGLAIDHALQRLYWIDAKLIRIESVALDGSDRRLVLEDMMVHPFSLAVFEDTFYWTDWTRQTLESCNKFSGGDHRVLVREEASDNIPMGVHAYHPLIQKVSSNPCWESGCAHLCLIGPHGRHRCTCAVGHHLGADSKRCESGDKASFDRLFLSAEDTLSEFIEASIGRSSFRTLSSRAKTVIAAVAYDPVHHAIIYSDAGSNELVSLDLKTDKQSILISGRAQGSIVALAVDWIGGNLYWADANHRILEVSRLDGHHRMVLVTHRMDHPTAMVLVPSKGYMLVAMTGSRPRIEKMDMDGSDQHVFIDYKMGAPTSLAVDYEAERLYWTDTSLGKIEWVTLDGKKRYSLQEYSGRPVSVAVTNQRILWTDESEESLMWISKNLSSKITSLPIQPHIRGKTATWMKLVIVQDQPQEISKDGKNGCDSSSNRCSHLCLPNQTGHICACPTGMTLGNDLKTCQTEIKCNSYEFSCENKSCIPIELTCDGHKDCDDGSDEKNCRPTCKEHQFECDDGFCIPSNLHCDHVTHCTDGSDEVGCPAVSCPVNYFACLNGRCIYGQLRCDGEADCEDHSDENDCARPTCPPEYFQCVSGPCVPLSWKCDGEPDCRDGSDEDSSCPVELRKCKSHEFACRNGRCIDEDLKCDMDDDCGDNSDEDQCDFKSCPSNMYRCPGYPKCILDKAVCDGFFDCPNGTDELLCEIDTSCKVDEFQCNASQTCIPNQWLCDGDNDCGDMSDEHMPQCHITDVAGAAAGPRSFLSLEEEMNHAVDSSKHQAKGRNVTDQCNHLQYSCDSGQCISITELCDHKPDCGDHSDEGSFCSTACARNNGGCSELCLPTRDGPVCWCRSGFQLDESMKACHDVDECAYLGACSQLCHNVPGTFACSCTHGYQLRSDHRSCKAEGPTPQLLLAFGTKLLSYKLGGNHVQVIAQKDEYNIREVDFDSRMGDIYWLDNNQGIVFRHSYATLTTSTVIKDLKSPSAFAVDWISRLLVYWDLNGYLVVCTLNGENCASILYVGIQNVGSIKLDPRKGTIFWTTWSSSGSRDNGAIESVCASGRRRALLASEKLIWPTGLALDYLHQSLYWVDVRLQLIETMEMNGRYRRVVSRSERVTHPMSLALFEDRLYWADWGKNAILDCQKHDCGDMAVLLQNVIKVQAMAIYHPIQQPNGTSPCVTRPIKCSHICVLVPKGFACLCPKGMRFGDETNTTCIHVTGPSSRMGKPSDGQCNNKVCFNGGTCRVRNGQWACQCRNGFSGERCESSARQEISDSSTAEAAEGSNGWVAGVVIGIIFIVGVLAALFFYCRRFGNGKFDPFAPIQFNNPRFNNNGEPDEDEEDNVPCDGGGEKCDSENFRSYSNPLFESPDMDITCSIIEGNDGVSYHINDSSLGFDSMIGTESTETLIDLTQEK